MSNLTSRLAASESASSTILAKDRTLSCDTRQTGLNNNALVIGPSGAGKTRNVLKPNLLQMNASYIVLDTKGTLCREVGPVLAAHGYRVQCLNFADLNTVPALAPGIERCGYNPLRHIRRKADGRPNQQDILSVAKAICPIEDNNQPFWDHAAANLLSCLIAYVTEQLPADEQTISSVIKLIEHLQDGATGRLFDDLITTDPQSYPSRYGGATPLRKMPSACTRASSASLPKRSCVWGSTVRHSSIVSAIRWTSLPWDTPPAPCL